MWTHQNICVEPRTTENLIYRRIYAHKRLANFRFIYGYWIIRGKQHSLNSFCKVNIVCQMLVWRFPLTGNQEDVSQSLQWLPLLQKSEGSSLVSFLWCEVIFSEKLHVCVCVSLSSGISSVFKAAHNVVVAFYCAFSHWESVYVTQRCVSWHWNKNSHIEPRHFCRFSWDSSMVPNLAAVLISCMSHDHNARLLLL